jgi:hypothetical protein
LNATVGTWLSLVEHSLGVRGVGSSNLPVPTNLQIILFHPLERSYHRELLCCFSRFFCDLFSSFLIFFCCFFCRFKYAFLDFDDLSCVLWWAGFEAARATVENPAQASSDR